MTQVLIIEDESAARNKIKRCLDKLEEPIEVVGEIEDVEGLQTFFQNPPKLDLIISDIQLRDGNVFSFLDQYPIHCPIIFTTAYNQFWTNAFEGMGIEYLLKPYNFTRFEKAWNKFKQITYQEQSSQKIISQLETLFKSQQQEKETTFRERFSYRKGNGIGFITTAHIALIKSEDGVVFLFDDRGNRLLCMDNGLQLIADTLDPNSFFQINRGEIVNKTHIEEIQRFSKNVIAVKLIGSKEWLKTSQSKTSEFNEWVKV